MRLGLTPSRFQINSRFQIILLLVAKFTDSMGVYRSNPTALPGREVGQAHVYRVSHFKVGRWKLAIRSVMKLNQD